MACWNDEPEWENEHHFLGPHKKLWDLQMEMNEMGKMIPSWQVHGWERIDGEWYALMVRSKEVVEEKVKKK